VDVPALWKDVKEVSVQAVTLEAEVMPVLGRNLAKDSLDNRTLDKEQHRQAFLALVQQAVAMQEVEVILGLLALDLLVVQQSLQLIPVSQDYLVTLDNLVSQDNLVILDNLVTLDNLGSQDNRDNLVGPDNMDNQGSRDNLVTLESMGNQVHLDSPDNLVNPGNLITLVNPDNMAS